MLAHLILKEIKEHIATPKMAVTSAVILLVMVVNGLVFNAQYNQKTAKIDGELLLQNEQQLQGEAAKGLWSLLFFDQTLIKSPSKLGFLSNAQEEALPNGMHANYFTESQPEFYKSQNPFFRRFRALDWTFILIYIISFVCLAFSYNAFSGEKAKGTLRLILSNAVPRGTLILGKLAGLALCVAIPLLLGLLINLLIIQFNPHIALSAADYGKVVVFAAIGLVFIVFNLLLGLLVSSLTARPAHTLNLLLIVWILLAIIIPSMAWVFAQERIQVVSEQKIAEQVAQERRKLWESGRYSLAWNGNWEGQPPNDRVLRRAAYYQDNDALRLNLYRDYLDQQFRQTDLAIGLSKTSPFALFRFIGERFSDNGYFGFKRFVGQARHYRTTLNDFLTQKDQQDADSHHLLWSEAWASRTFGSQQPVAPAEVPRFVYQTPNLTEILDGAKWDLALLAFWCVLLFAGTFVAFIRYDVR